MRRILFSLAIPIAACTAQPVPIGAARADALAGRVASPPQACIPVQSASSLRVIDPATLAYGSGRTVYVNRLRAPCAGLNELSTIIIDVHGTQYCNGDHFRALEVGSTIPGAVCLLGDWVPYRTP